MPDHPGYGARRWWLWWHGLRDRGQGATGRANARWGYLRPPPGDGRLVWLKAGHSRDSVLLAAELAAALRRYRLDIRLVVTVEREYPQLLDARLKGLKGVGYGYGPCDAKRAVKRTLRRLAPFGLIWVDTPLRKNLLALSEASVGHRVALAAPPAQGGPLEAAYPISPGQAQAWERGQGARAIGPTADPLALLVESQVRPTLRSLVREGGAETQLWWAHGLDRAAADELIRCWRQAGLDRDGVLFLSGEEGAPSAQAVGRDLQGAGVPMVIISQWDRSGLSPGTVVVVDDPRWVAAVAGSSLAGLLVDASRWVLWQALAVGLPLHVPARWAADHALLERTEAAVEPYREPAEVMARWRAYRDAPGQARRRGDGARRLFWAERRRAEALRDDFLQRVYDW